MDRLGLALGAQPSQVTALVLREGAVLAGAGLLCGLAGGAVAACWLPARRASAISPLEAIRTE